MILHIDTSQGQNIKIAVKDGDRNVVTKKFSAQYSQAEKLLPKIDKLLKAKKIKLSQIKKIKVNNKGNSKTSFTALRIGVVSANALAFALNIPVEDKSGRQNKAIKPIYNKEPNITKPVKRLGG